MENSVEWPAHLPLVRGGGVSLYIYIIVFKNKNKKIQYFIFNYLYIYIIIFKNDSKKFGNNSLKILFSHFFALFPLEVFFQVIVA